MRTFWGKSTNLHSLWDSGMLELYAFAFPLMTSSSILTHQGGGKKL